ncbi:hypothetical protein [Bizionia sp. M204]|uniref:hypothetical protein n=1 Tax=Bizionia sp. M204 TaxID=2675331 RepID=UPI0020468DFA|nr:hypothetical protein [Bizionia sp. M204]UPS93090.1 hypothetical protein GMA17_09060 [Bizionia sp. M204]
MKNQFLKKILLLTTMLISFNSFACECITYAVVDGKSHKELKLEASFEYATIIFYGNYIGNGKFESIKIYRGKKMLLNKKLIEEKDVRTNCDYYFEENKKYLVFGKIDENGKLQTSVCLSNSQIDNKSELKFVKKYLKK